LAVLSASLLEKTFRLKAKSSLAKSINSQ